MAKSLVVTLLAATAIFLTAALLMQVRKTPRFVRVKAAYRSSERAILDRNGLIIDALHVNSGLRRLNWVSVGEISPAFTDALAFAGESRISAQLIDLLYGESAQNDFTSKMTRAWRSFVLELTWSQREILEAYVNLVIYRGELQGLAAASFGLFDTTPEALTRGESALIVALIRARTADRAKEKACEILIRLGSDSECGMLTPQHLYSIEQSYRIRPFLRLAPDFAKRLNAEVPSGTLVRSSLDRETQWQTMQSLKRRGEGAAIVIENTSGKVLAYVGNAAAPDAAGAVDQAMLQKPSGSALKPLIYGKAIDERILTAATIVENSPFAISLAGGRSHHIRQSVSVRRALAENLDIPAVNILDLLNVESFVQTLSDLGFTGLDRAETYSPALAIGSGSVRLSELTNAYRALANGGVWTQLRFSPEVLSDQTPRRVLSPEAAFIVGDVLAQNKTLPGSGWLAVENAGDGWCIGYSDKFTVGVWTEDAQNAAPVWQEIVKRLHDSEKSHAPDIPGGLLQRHVDFAAGTPAHEEWFLTGTEPKAGKPESPSRITYPVDQSTIALDERASVDSRHMFIQIVGPHSDQNLYLNGHRLGRAKPYLPWVPISGKFTLELRDSKGQVVDRVRFEVRGRSFAAVI